MTTPSRYRVLPPVPQGHGGHFIRAVGGTIAPVGSVEVRSSAHGRAEIFNLQVAQPYRRQGVGRLLVNAAVQAASARGLTPFLEARPGDSSISAPALVAMYQRMGFRVIGASPRGIPMMERRQGGPILPPPPVQAKLAMPPPPRSPVVQRMKRRKITTAGPAPTRTSLPLPEDLIMYIFSYLADLDLFRLAQVSRTFYEMVPRIFLSNINYVGDPKPVRPRGQSKTPIRADEHLAAAINALRQAFQIRAFQPKTEIILYRVSDKDTLTQTEKERYVVPGPFWTVEKTAAWILGGMLARVPFVLLTPPTEESNFREGKKTGRGADKGPAIYAREILQLLHNGYTIGTATREERPHKYRDRRDLLILRPPAWNQGTLATTRTSLDSSIWNRHSSQLVVTVNGTPVSFEMLNEFFTIAIEDLRSVVDMVSLCSSFDSKFNKRPPDHDEDEGGLGGGGGNQGMVY